MKQDQKFTPKYWVLHDKTTDDVFTDSMRKSRADVCSMLKTTSRRLVYG